VGGNIKAYERLIQRARREALIRLKEESNIRGFNKIINVKFGNCQVSGKFLSAVEVVAYGTAIKILKT
ncbi:MAG: YbjQ family protein, partial [Sphingomonadales bacterium]